MDSLTILSTLYFSLISFPFFLIFCTCRCFDIIFNNRFNPYLI
jgi:hypothetical protein